MENNDKKLGRGLSALLGENKNKNKIELANKSNGEEINLVALDKIIAGKYQPRELFNQNEIDELSKSIKANGLIQPIILRKVGEEDKYEIIAGERRYRASKQANLKQIPAIIKKLNNHQALELAIIENVQRSDLTIIEEAKSYQRLMDEFSYTQEEVGQKIGKSRSHVTNSLRLLKLPKNIQELLNSKLIKMGHARAIINADNKEKLVKDIIEKKLSVRDIEEIVKEEKEQNQDHDDQSHNLPLMIRTESSIKYINKEHLTFFEESIFKNTTLKAKISYNSMLNKGKVTLKFDDIDKLHKFVKKIEGK